MAENIHICLSEEMEQDLLSRYRTLCDELTVILSQMIQELEELCNRTHYEPMVDAVNDTVSLLNGEIYDISNQALEQWLNGSGCFSATSEMSRAGDEVIETARQIEQNIKDIFDGFWMAYPMGEGIQVDTTRPTFKLEDFEELKEVYTRFFQEAEVIGEDVIHQMMEQGDDDPTYNLIIPAVKAITEPIRIFFEQPCVKADELLYQVSNFEWDSDIMTQKINNYVAHNFFKFDMDGAVEFLEFVCYLRVLSQKYADDNAETLAAIKKDEYALWLLLRDASKAELYNERKRMRQLYKEKLAEIKVQISDNKKKITSPIISFLEKCSEDIVLIPRNNTKVDFISLRSYQAMVYEFSRNLDLMEASKECLNILDSQIDSLTRTRCRNDSDELQNQLAITRNKILRRAIIFFADKYEGKESEKTSLSDTFEEIYLSVESEVEAYKKAYEFKTGIFGDLQKLSEERDRIQDAIDTLDSNPDELEIAEKKAIRHINAFANYVFDTAYKMGSCEWRGREIPTAKYSFERGHIKWEFDKGGLDQEIKEIADGILGKFVNRYRY